jgi:hypothetical protein
MGGYAIQPRETLLTREPPPPGSAAPDIVALKGLRAVFQTEIETSTTSSLRTSWLKKLPDDATVWRARNLYSNEEVAFRLRCVPFMCANAIPQFTAIDGGLIRRVLAIPYEYRFVANPSGEPGSNERVAVGEGCKTEDWLLPRMPGYLYILNKCLRHYFTRGGLAAIPTKVKECMETVLCSSVVTAIKDWCNDEANVVHCEARHGMTTYVLLGHLEKDGVFAGISEASTRKLLLLRVVQNVDTQFGRGRARLIGSGRFIRRP